jgi:glucosyl-3-phosphoglycerate synthase
MAPINDREFPVPSHCRVFDRTQFSDIERLIDVKVCKKLVVSVVIPTLDEERTIGSIVSRLKSELVEKAPLIDEVLVIDSGSIDRTGELARANDATFHLASDVLPEHGNKTGKGENLWKSLYVTRGDIIVWLDADIHDFNIDFVTGLLGPLLFYDDIQYVKGFYRRPFQVGDKTLDNQGGRMTELLTRPFLSCFYPELCRFVQPMSGELAGRRRALERIPFSIDNSVDVLHLVDVSRLFGLTTIAQVDLGVRTHRHHDIALLGRRSFTVLKALLTRGHQDGRLKLTRDLPSEYLQYSYATQTWQESVLDNGERPPMISIMAYQRKFGVEPGYNPDTGGIPPPGLGVVETSDQAVNILMKEYEVTCSEIRMRLESQYKLSQYGILMFSIFFTFFGALLQTKVIDLTNPQELVTWLCILPFPFVLMVAMYQEHNFFIAKLGAFVAKPLSEYLAFQNGRKLILWEDFIGKHRTLEHDILTGSRFLFLVSLALAPVVFAVYLVWQYDVLISLWDGVFCSFNLVTLMFLVLLRSKTIERFKAIRRG